MLGLVDYGSDSDSNNDSSEESLPKGEIVVSSKAKKSPSGSKPSAAENAGILPDDEFFGDADTLEGDSFLDLPSAEGTSAVRHETPEGALDEIVKPKDWELKLAEKERKRLKKAKKREKREKKRLRKEQENGETEGGERAGKEKVEAVGKPKQKAKISAFGALSAIADAGSDSEDESPKVSAPTASTGSSLLSMLPAPKSTARVPGTKPSIMLPPSMRDKKAAPKPSTAKRPLVPAGSDSDSDVDSSDFFGLSAKQDAKNPRLDIAPTDIPIMPVYGLDAVAGPSQPTEEDVHPSHMYNMASAEGSTSAYEGAITDADAHRLIVQHESNFGGTSLGEAVGNIVDVSVNDALGPDVHAQLLRNLTSKSLAKSAMAPLPKAQNVRDQTAKRKHQITYLAQMAVAREEALQEQWAENRHKKKAAAQKYGF